MRQNYMKIIAELMLATIGLAGVWFYVLTQLPASLGITTGVLGIWILLSCLEYMKRARKFFA